MNVTANTDLNTLTSGELAGLIWDNDAVRRNPQHSAAEYCWSVELDRRILVVLQKRTNDRLAALGQSVAA